MTEVFVYLSQVWLRVSGMNMCYVTIHFLVHKYISIKTVVMFDLSKTILIFYNLVPLINYIYSIVLYDQFRINGDKLTIQNWSLSVVGLGYNYVQIFFSKNIKYICVVLT